MKLHSAIFYTNDINRIIEFYRDFLHLQVKYLQEDIYVSFIVGSSMLGIKKAKEEREIPGHQAIFISVSNIEEMYREIKSKLTILKPLTREDWATNFSILDPDGNKVQFVQEER